MDDNHKCQKYIKSVDENHKYGPKDCKDMHDNGQFLRIEAEVYEGVYADACLKGSCSLLLTIPQPYEYVGSTVSSFCSIHF
jgi:hypothetical protein